MWCFFMRPESVDIILSYLDDLKAQRDELLKKLERRKRQKAFINNEIKKLNNEIKKIDEDIKFWRGKLKEVAKKSNK